MNDELGLIGDVHGELDALRSALAWFERTGVQRVACAGDVADGPGDVNGCYELLSERGVATVRGNHDRWLLNDQLRELPHATARSQLTPHGLRFLLSLPRTRVLDTPHGTLLLCHGLGDDDMCGLFPHDEGHALETNFALREIVESSAHRFVVAGHTHQRMVRRIGAVTFINPGTLLRTDDPAIASVDFTAGRVSFWRLAAGDCVDAGSVPLE